MPKLTNRVPSYRLHKQSGQAIVNLNGRDFLLGRHGSKASRTQYNRLVAEWLANDRQPFTDQTGLTIGELAARYWSFASRYYVKGGLPTQEQNGIKAALRPLLRLYENELASTPPQPSSVFSTSSARWIEQPSRPTVELARRQFAPLPAEK